MDQSCITEDNKNIILNLIEVAETPQEKVLFKKIVDKIPICEFATATKAPGTAASRKMAPRWPPAVYYNEKGEAEPWDSPSQLYEHLTGRKVSGQLCNEEGTACRALSLVDNFIISGFIVRGNGEPPPPSIGTRSEVERAHQAWKEHLNATGKKFLVFHPKAPLVKEMQEKAERVKKG